MNQLFDLGQLPWVKSELIEALSQARQALEVHAEEPEAEDVLVSLVKHLHQVSGTLRMVQVLGAALLAEEMESLANAMRERATSRHDDARESLMRAMLQLPDYLDRLAAGHRDLPTVLLPIVNDMRSVRGAEPLTEIALFAPDLSRELPADLRNKAAVGDLQQEAKVLRSRFQRALLAWFRGADVKTSLNTLAAVLGRLQVLCQSSSARRLWWVAAGAVDAVAAGAVEDSVAVHRVIGKLDRQIKELGETGESGLTEQSSADLFTQLLYFVARAPDVAGRVSDIKECYQLHELLPGAAEQAQAQESLSGQNADLFASVGTAVKEEIGGLKDSLDLIVRSGGEPGERVEGLKNALTALGDTLSVLGLEDAKHALLAHADQLAKWVAAGQSIEVSSLMDLASTLLFIEASVERLAVGRSDNDQIDAAEPYDRVKQAEYGKVTVAVTKEAIENLGRAKDAVSSYSQTENGASFLNEVPQLLAQVRGALSLLGEERAAALTESVGRYVQEQLISANRRPSSQELESLADSVCGLEYFLESLRDQGLYGESAMQVAEASVSDLGYGVEEAGDTQCAETIGSPLEEGLALMDIIDQASEGGAASLSTDVDREQESIDAEDADDAVQPVEAQADPAANPLPAAMQELQTDRSGESLPTRPTGLTASTQADDSGQSSASDLPVAGEDVEQEIVDIFLEEAEEEIEKIREQLPVWTRTPRHAESLTMLRRSFHTLKGSGRLVGARRISELAWAYEDMLNRVIDGAIQADHTVLDSVASATAMLPDLVQEIKDGHAGPQPVAKLIQRAQAIVDGTPVSEEVKARQADTDSTVAPTATGADVSSSETFERDRQEQVAPDMQGGFGASGAQLGQIPADAPALSPAQFYIEVVEGLLADLETKPDLDGAVVSRLNGSCSGLSSEHGGPVRELCAQLVSYAESLLSAHQPVPADACRSLQDSVCAMKAVVNDDAGEEAAQQLIFQALQWLQEWCQTVPVADSERTDNTERVGDGGSAEHLADPRDDDQLLTAAEAEMASGAPTDGSLQTNTAASEQPPADAEHSDASGSDMEPMGSEQAAALESDAYAQHDVQLLEIFLEESEKNLETGEAALQRWRHHPDDDEALAELQRTLHTLKGGARMADLAPIGDLAHAVESLVIAIAEKRPGRPTEAFDAVQVAHDRLVSMLEDVSRRRPLTSECDLIARLRAFHLPPEAPAPSDSQPAESGPAPTGAAGSVTDTEDEIVAVFVEEAALLLENIDSTLHAWKREPHQSAVMESLQRHLHTLKGGARMAGFSAMGDLAHAVESLVEQISSGLVEINESTVALMGEACDSLATMFDRVERREQITAIPGLVEKLEALSENDAGATAPVDNASEHAVPAESGEHTEGVVPRNEERRATSRSSHELVRVSADLLDNMVNCAGEVSIYRSRLEQQIGAYRFNLVEMDQTVSRLRDQLRKLEIETEAQILFRHEKDVLSGNAEFDPLELDRYSHMQELSRSLLESVGDLASIQNLLESVTRESETLLLQQSRVNTELQEGLMRTRMVPFLGLAPRMRRIVRQICHELGKKAELELSGADGEMDRTVVDRLIAPIEHMLRNAVSHGIEAPELRRQTGKREAGMIRIRLEREGTDIVLNIADDGAGIDLGAIRRKAIERGLMQPDTELPDNEVLQFILETGFSTADRVTQVAGRGVGMDVVNSEVKQLGGVLRIDSEPGQGTSFTIRLPFTLALNQALLIEVGEDTYAVPLSTIEGVVRMDAERINAFYADPEARFEYGGMAYEVRHLGTMLGGAQARPESGSGTLPVLLARTGERCVGFHVEKLLGNREIVVKSVGPQISTVTGITGATILGDGRVVMILDVASLLRGTTPAVAPRVLETPPRADRGGPVTVMIVDDSITVRKVTTRLLERNEMQVIAAKDGLDAVALLQDHVPDIILLDIEMPRMDGFEVATHVRNEHRLRGIPIIMITSRTGDKHRQRAMQAGVNRYLGKPFQENDLVANIRELLSESGSTEAASDA